MSDLLQVSDLEKAKKHDTFHSEVITGKAGGLSTGANIDYATNAVTGQVQKTLPATVNGIDWSPVGNLTTDNCTFTKSTDYAVDDNGTQWAYNGTFPFTSTAPVVPSAPDYYVVHVKSASEISNANGGSVQDFIDGFGVSVNIADYVDLKAAIAALPVFGGTVYVPAGKFYAGDWTYNTDYMSKPNVSLVGQKMPTWNGDASELVGGSIIEGRFNAFADNFSMINIGFDLGKNVVAARFGGASTTSPDYPVGGGTWDAFAFAQPNMVSPLAQRKSFSAKNVICLCKQPDTLGHAFLSEGYNGGYIDNVIGIYSVHAAVIKAQNVRFGSIEGYMSAGEGLIIKSDSYTDCGYIQGDSVNTSKILHNCTPHIIPTSMMQGLQLLANDVPFSGPIQIDKVTALGVTIGVDMLGTTGTDIQIGEIISDGFIGSMAYGMRVGASGQFRRVQVGSFICNNASTAIDCAHPQADSLQSQVNIGMMSLQNIAINAITAREYGKVTVDSISGDSVNTLYNFTGDNSRIIIGNEKVSNVSNIFSTPITLSAGWVNFGAPQQPFTVKLSNYGVDLFGLIRAAATPSSSIAALPVNIAPFHDTRQLAYINRSGARSVALVNVDGTNGIGIDDGTAPLAADYLSLDGVGWII